MPALGRCKSECDTSATNVLASMPCFVCPELPDIPGILTLFSPTERYMSLDGGSSFEKVPHNGGNIRKVIRLNTGRLVAIAITPVFLETSDDNGITWTVRHTYSDFNATVNSHLFALGGKVFHNAQDDIHYSLDGGTTWLPLPDPAGETIRSIMPYRDLSILGDNGIGDYWTTDDLGVTWTPFDVPPAMNGVGNVYISETGRTLLVSRSAVQNVPEDVLAWSDDGITWNVINLTETTTQNGCYQIDYVPFLNKIVVSRGGPELIVGSPDMTSWSLVSLPITYNDIYGFFTVYDDALWFPPDTGELLTKVTSLIPLVFTRDNVGATLEGPLTLPKS